MISSKLMHLVANRAQEIMGLIDMAIVHKGEEKRLAHLERAKTRLQALTALLQARVRESTKGR
jgi:two-component sensor histidine kinase